MEFSLLINVFSMVVMKAVSNMSLDSKKTPKLERNKEIFISSVSWNIYSTWNKKTQYLEVQFHEFIYL